MFKGIDHRVPPSVTTGIMGRDALGIESHERQSHGRQSEKVAEANGKKNGRLLFFTYS